MSGSSSITNNRFTAVLPSESRGLSRLDGFRNVNLRDPIAIDVHTRARAAEPVYAAALNDNFTGPDASLQALAGLFAARLTELRRFKSLYPYPLAATAQGSAVDRRAPLAGESGGCAKQRSEGEANQACPGEHAYIVISGVCPQKGIFRAAAKTAARAGKNSLRQSF
ncbi:MAG TPA: hypothetical protein VFR66_04410 [Burkholderiales bacterium]|nr:hypothetical protein [Burkholderiales bacterium]